MGGFFFFCKQKTAYEMRISDWSSDVCSSDLSPGEGTQHRPFPGWRGDLHRAGRQCPADARFDGRGTGMIIGFGSDLCSIDRIQSSLDRFGQRFIDRVFTDIEQAKASRRELTRAGTYAKRFAAKEACAKALGTGFRAGVFFRDMGVVNDPSGDRKSVV